MYHTVAVISIILDYAVHPVLLYPAWYTVTKSTGTFSAGLRIGGASERGKSADVT